MQKVVIISNQLAQVENTLQNSYLPSMRLDFSRGALFIPAIEPCASN